MTCGKICENLKKGCRIAKARDDPHRHLRGILISKIAMCRFQAGVVGESDINM